MLSILLSSIITVACSGKFPKEAKECEIRLLQCYKKEINEDFYKRYEQEYRKAMVLQHCREINGVTK